MSNITFSEIEEAMSKIKGNMAPIIVIKSNENKRFFNLCLQEKSITTKWNNAVTVMFYKKGDRTGLENYRSINLLSYIY